MSRARYSLTLLRQNRLEGGPLGQVAYSIAEAAHVTATTEAIIKDEIRLGKLRMRRAGLTTPVILHTDLTAWADLLPEFG